MFRLERPSMAVNDPRAAGGTPPNVSIRRFQMWRTWDIRADESRQHIIDHVATIANEAPGHKLKNLVLSCHGNSASLQLGQGFDSRHISMFAPWHGRIEKIWLPDCLVASTSSVGNGHVFCANLAKKVSCYVVASTEEQCDAPISFPLDMMSSFEGLVVCYNPEGNISWSQRNPSTWTDSRGVCVPVPD